MFPFIEFQNFKISVYFVTLAIVYCIGIQYYFYRLKKFPLKPSIAADLLFVLMVFGFIGARLFYVLYQEPEFYVQNLKQIFYVWNGGFVYYGGFLASVFAGILFLKLKKQNIFLWLDVSAPVAALSYGLGRLACFFNGCCYGAETDVFWGFKFPHLHGLRHPTQLYAVVYEIGVWLLLLLLEKKLNFMKAGKGALFFTWLLLHGVGRIVMETLRDDSRGELIFGFTISTWISLILIILSATLLKLRCQVPHSGHTASP